MHAVESLFYVSNESNGRFVPWHGLGTPVEEAPTSADAIRLAGLDWKVRQDDVVVNNNIVNGYKANVRDTDNSVLGIVSDKYQVVNNSDAFDFTDSLIEENVRYETAGSLRDGKQVWLLAQMPIKKVLDDEVANYVCFSNTHDGTGAIKVCLTPVRVVCNNTLNLALNTAKRCWSTKHMGDMSSKLIEAKNTLFMADKYMDELAKKADVYANSKITEDQINDILSEMFPVKDDDSDRKKNNVNQFKENFQICYLAPDLWKFRGTQWGAINAMADLVDHSKPSRVTESYQENNWGRIMSGHPMLDKFVELVNNLRVAA